MLGSTEDIEIHTLGTTEKLLNLGRIEPEHYGQHRAFKCTRPYSIADPPGGSNDFYLHPQLRAVPRKSLSGA